MKFERLALLGFTPADLAGPPGKTLVRELEDRAYVVSIAADVADVRGADALVLQLGTGADRTLFEQARSLRFLGVFGTDQSRVDLESAAERGITVANVPGYSTDSVAEFVVATLLERLRSLEEEKARARKRDLGDGPGGTTLGKKRLGIIGFGRIGQRVAEIVRRGFGAAVGYWSRTRRPERERELGVVWQELNTLAASSDLVSIHLPLTKATVGLIDRGVLSQSAPDALWIHTSPMGIIDIEALDERLLVGDFSFVFDHADELDPAVLERLSRHARCVPYPPVACNTDSAQAQKLQSFMASVDAFLRVTG